MKLTIVHIIFLFSYNLIAQTKTVSVDENSIIAFLSINEANKINKDSVKGLILISNNFKDFPKEILEYKNLQYLVIGSYRWGMVLDSLTLKQRKEYEKLQKKICDRCEVQKFYKPNRIKRIPSEIKKLDKLKFIDFSSVLFNNICEMNKLYIYLPNTECIPDQKSLNEDFNCNKKHQTN